MGEAKWRGRTEKNFGSVPKEAKYRGIVVSPPLEIEGSKLFVRSSNLDPQELRFSLLFWDKLVWPSSRNIYFSSGPDEQFLEDTGILTRPDYTINGDGAQGIANGQIQAYRDLERSNPGVWALAQGENSLLIKGGLAEEGRGVLLELNRAIPIPSANVPLADILEFKLRRKDELNLFRYKIEAFMQAIESSSDKKEAISNCISEIDAACSDLVTVGKEFQFPMYLSNFKASFNFSPSKFLIPGLGGFLGAGKYGLAATAAAAAASIISTIELKADIGFQPIKREANPFRYAYSIDRYL